MVTLLIMPMFVQVSAQDGVKMLSREKYSIEYPADWELDESGRMNTSFFLFSPLSSASDGFRENVNLMIQDLGGSGMGLDDFTELSLTQIIAGGGVISTNEQVASEPPKNKLIYSMGQQGQRFKAFQYYWVIGDMAFILTLTCAEDEFDNYVDQGEKILNSFKLK